MTARKNTKVAEVEVIEVEADAPAAEVFSPKAIATELNIDAKSFRRFLRSQTENRAGKGGRWAFDADAKAAIIAAYNTRNAGTAPILAEATTDAD